MNCPECQKMFLVRQEDLTQGTVRFQCTGCQTYFSFDWPQPPGTLSVKATKVESKEFTPANPPAAKLTRPCLNCGEKVDVKAKECPKCGILMDKVKKIKPADPVLQATGPEVVAAWEAVKTNYSDEKRHESFIQLSLSRDSLPFASSQYRAILNVNPNDDIAKRMQNKIIDLATTAYIAAQTSMRGTEPTRAQKMMIVVIGLAGIMIFVGATATSLRPLAAVGVSILAFVFVARTLNKRS